VFIVSSIPGFSDLQSVVAEHYTGITPAVLDVD